MSAIKTTENVDARLNAVIASLVTLIALGVYAWCVTPTVPYWDSGEYIATSYILGVPHPPGTPLYVLIGRLFSLIPIATIAVRVNLLSSLSAAIAVLFTYLITVRLVRLSFPETGRLAFAGGIIAAFMMAFSSTFWDNAIEAEVYASSSAIMCLCVWLALLWWEREGQGREQNDRILWLVLYVLFLAIGVHLGTFLVFPCIYLLVTMVRWHRVKRGSFWASVLLFAVAQLIFYGVMVQANRQYNITELSIAPPGVKATAQGIQALMALAIVWNLLAVLGRRFVVGMVGFAILGVSVHYYLLIRAGLDPAINEGDPHTWESLKLLLIRDQYKPPEPIFRKAPIFYQLDHMYLRYFGWQFELFELNNLPTRLLPILVGCYGAWVNSMRERKSFFLMLTLFLITGPFLVYYLNFKQGEVRERDYFFVANYHFFAIWIGFGSVALLNFLATKLRLSKERATGHPAVLGAAAGLVLMSVAPLLAGDGNNNFYRHDRRGNYVAHGYGHNILVGLDPDALIFTNGDNDTFPLWYIQEVEGFRKDVRVVNVSLLQTHWYIKQLRDYEPTVPINMTDAEIDRLQPYRDQEGQIHLVNDTMIRHIIEANDWKRPVYFAVTVPDQRGFDRQVKMEGMVFRVYKDPVDAPYDTAKLDENLNGKYHFRGFLDENGEWDESTYKDDQATKLLQNYVAARVRLAMGLNAEGQVDRARGELDKIRRFSYRFPAIGVALGVTYQQIGFEDEAVRYYEEILEQDPDNARFLGALGHIQFLQGDTVGALRSLNRSIEINPATDFNPYVELVNIHTRRGDVNAAATLLRQWLRHNPQDTRVQNYLNSIIGGR